MDPEEKLPYKLQGAIWKAPKAKYKPSPEDYVNRPKAFANPAHPGYGGAAWPFDMSMAMHNPAYRTGIRNAINAEWTDGYWKYEAKTLLSRVLDILIQIELEREAMDRQDDLFH